MISYSELKRHIIASSAKDLVPVGAEFEITSRCNLKCHMCYVRDNCTKDLSTKTWLDIFSKARDKGLFFALLTGGEVFMRKDFFKLYDALYDMGVKITIYTNGTLIDEKIAKKLALRPPEAIGITLYGATNDSYYQVTNNRNGFSEVNRGISWLQKYGINIFLRTIAIPEIFPVVDDIIAYAKSKDIPMQYSLYVGPSRNQCLTPSRLAPIDLITYEKKFTKNFGVLNNQEFRNSPNGFTCVALKSAYFITYDGYMQPCAMLKYPQMSILENDFDYTWETLIKEMDKIAKCDDCEKCPVNNFCIQCPAKLYLEGGFTNCSEYLKAIAEIRSEVDYEDL